MASKCKEDNNFYFKINMWPAIRLERYKGCPVTEWHSNWDFPNMEYSKLLSR